MPTGIEYGIIGGAATLGGMGLMFRWMNNKIDKKQDVTMCDERSGNLKDTLEEIKDTQKEILKEIRVKNGTK